MKRKNCIRVIVWILILFTLICSVDMPVWADDDIVLPVLGYSMDMDCYEAVSVTDYVEADNELGDADATIFAYEELSQEADYWDEFSTEYYYNQLENDYEREFWNGLKSVCDEILYTSGGVKEITLSNRRAYSTAYVPMKGDLSSNRATEILKLFYGSNPQYYFIENGYISYGTSFGYAVYDDFASSTARKNATDEYKKAIDSAIYSINKTTDLDTILQIQKCVCELTVYNYDASNRIVSEEISKSQSGYSCFVMNKTVCSGYAHAIQLLCNYFDIDSTILYSSNHAWNLVKCDDNWYQIDSTWADQNSGIYYGYFMKSYSEYMSDSSHIAYSWMYSYSPSATLDSTIPYNWSSAGISIPTVIESIEATYAIDKGISGYTVTLCPNDNRNLNIYYTLDGTCPDEAKTKSYKYKTPIKLETENQVNALRFIAVCDRYRDSAVINVSVGDIKIKMLGASARSTADSIEFDIQYEVSPEIYTDKSISIKTNDSMSNANVYSISNLSAEYISGNNKYKVTVPLYVKSKEMADTCSVQFYQGTNPISTNYEQSFANYLKSILTKYSTESNEYKCAYKLAQLGDASQKYFEYNMQSPVNSVTGITSNSNTSNDSTIASRLRTYHKSAFIDNSEQMDYVGTSLSLKDDVTINYYFSVSDSFNINALTISNNSDKAISVNKVGSNVIRISMKDVQYTDVKKIFKYKIYYDKVVAMEVDYSMGDYIAAVLSDSSKSSSLRTLCRAMYTLTE